MEKIEKSSEDYYIFRPEGLTDAFRLFVHVKHYSLKDFINRNPFYVKKGEIREIIDYGKVPTVEISCCTHCSTGTFYYSRAGVKKTLGDDYQTFAVEGNWKNYFFSAYLGSKGEGKPFVILFSLIGVSFLLCQAFRHWIFPFCHFARGNEIALCQSPLVQHSIESSATTLMYLSWTLALLFLGIYFAFYVKKKEKHTFCVTKTRWAGIFFLTIGVTLGFKMTHDFLNNDKYKISFALFDIARDPASMYKPEYNEIRQSFKIKSSGVNKD